MQHFQQSSPELDEIAFPKYGIRQRLLSGSLSLAVTSSAAVTASLANVPAPVFSPAMSGGPVHVVHPVNPPIVHSLHSVVPTGTSHTWHTGSANVVSNVSGSNTGAGDINLASASAIFPANSLAGFNTLTLNIGGHQKTFDANASLTGAELVAAQQVLSGGKQTLVINASGVATGGTFSLNGSTVGALDGALKGNISGLDISKGVTAVDSLSSLSLGGTLVNQGKLDIGASGQTLDTISASNITNASGASISGVSGTAVGLSATGSFSNCGKISNASDVNISAPTITNSGSITSTAGNVNLSGVGGNLAVVGAGGTIQSSQNINLGATAGNSNITVSGGNWLSQNLNFNAGTGTVEASLDQVNGAVNGTAGCAHVTAATANLDLGNLTVTGDPTYFNTAGNILITGVVTQSADTAIVASGNIIGSGGTLDSTNKAITLIAGANITSTGGGTPSTNTTGGGDVLATITVDNSTAAGNGSKTGGFIDLSGSTLTTKNAPVSDINSGGGNILMVAYKGTGANSGSIVGTGTVKSGGAASIAAGTGTVTLIGGGAQLTAQNITGGDISILAGTPTLSGTLSITNGTLSGATYSTTSNSNTAVNLTSITSSGNVAISTGGKTNSTSKAPLALVANGLTFTGTGTTSSLFVNSTGAGTLTLNPTSASSLGGTLSVTAAGNIAVANNITGSKDIVDLTATAGTITGAGIINGATSTLKASGTINVNTGVNTLTVNSTGGAVTVNESASAGKALSLLASSSSGGTGNAFSLTSAQTVNVNGTVTSTGDIDLTETGNTNAVGLKIAASLVEPSNQTIKLTTTGNDSITGTKVISASSVVINGSGNVGTSGAPLLTNVNGGDLLLNGSSVLTPTTPAFFIKDSDAVSFNLGSNAATTGAAVTLTSTAPNIFMGASLLFNNVTITETAKGATLSLAGNKTNIGTGAGAVKITAPGGIVANVGGIAGTTVTLTSTTGSIGASGAAIPVVANVLADSAVKGNVFVNGSQSMSLGTGTALNTYSVTMAKGTALNIGGIVTATAKNTGAVSLTADTITQGPATAFLVAPNVSLNTSAGGSIGVGQGFQSIQTKAAVSLSIQGAANSTAFVTQTGTITLLASSVMTAGAGSTLNLALASGNKLTVENTIGWDNNNITAPTSLTVTAPGVISGTNVTITSPLDVLNNAGSIAVTGTGLASFVSGTSLAINGTGSVTLPAGSSLSVSGLSSITLGTAGANDPLSTGINSGKLSNLNIFTKGAFNGNYQDFTTASASLNDSLSFSASTFNNTGGFKAGPFILTSSNISFALTGGQATTIGATAVVSGQPQFELNSLLAGSFVSATAGGILNVDPAGLLFTSTGNSIALAGRNINTNLIVNPLYFTTLNSFANVSLVSTSGTFTVGATTTAQKNNGIVGGITATSSVTVSGPSGVTVQTASTVSGNQITFNTSNFKLNDTSAVTGTGKFSSLTISNVNAGTLTIGGTGGTNNIGGTYTGITSVTLQSTTGGINAGKLFTTLNGANNMLDSGIVDNIAISATGSLTLDPSVGVLQVAAGAANSIFLSATSVSTPNATKAGQSFLTLQATNGTVSLFVTNAAPTVALTLGQLTGNLDISVGASGSFTASTGNQLNVNETQSVTNAALFGSNIVVNNNVTASGTLQVEASGTPLSTISEGVGVILATGAKGTLFIGQGLPTMPLTALNIQTPNLVVVNGALNLNNTFAGNVNVSQQLSIAPLTALTLTNTSGSSSNNLFVNTLLAAAGSIDIVNNNGGLIVTNGSTLQTSIGTVISVPAGTDGTKAGPPGTFAPVVSSGGSITLQDNDFTSGFIVIGGGVNIDTKATLPTTGQVSIVIGAVPVTGLAAGAQAAPNPTINSTSGGGQIFFTTTANPTGSISSFGLNTLNAVGTNIVFNARGNSNNIVLTGNDNITADPVAAAPAAAAVPAVVSNLGNAIIAAPTLNNFAPTTNPTIGSVGGASAQSTSLGVYASNQMPTLNWSLPTTMAINANVADISASGIAAIENSTMVSGQIGDAIGTVGEASGTRGTKVLTGGVSNAAVQTLDNGATLLAPKAQTTLNTGFGTVDVAAGSVVMVMAFDGGLAVYNLHDTKSGAVRVTVGGSTIKLSPGQNAVMTSKQIHCFEEINPLQFATYRSMAAKDLGNGVQSFKSEFDIRSVLQNVGALRSMVRAEDSDTRKVVNSVLKTSAILSQLSGNQYQYMVAPPKTAMAVR